MCAVCDNAKKYAHFFCIVEVFTTFVPREQAMKEMKDKKTLTIKTITKSNVWDIQENDVIRMLEAAQKDSELRESIPHFVDIFRSAFEMEVINGEREDVVNGYTERGYKVHTCKSEEGLEECYAIKKRPIMRVTDLTYENIRHISAAKLLEVIERNFGGGWDSLSQSIQDVIESGFDITTTTLPNSRLHKAGGLYEKKVADGYDVLEIAKGLWTEAIFAKVKPMMEKPRLNVEPNDNAKPLADIANEGDNADDMDEELPAEEELYDDEDEDDFDDDKLTEESYRTTIETTPEELSLEAEDVAGDEEY